MLESPQLRVGGWAGTSPTHLPQYAVHGNVWCPQRLHVLQAAFPRKDLPDLKASFSKEVLGNDLGARITG